MVCSDYAFSFHAILSINTGAQAVWRRTSAPLCVCVHAHGVQNPIKGERARRALGLRSLRWKLNPVGPCRSPQGPECFVGARGKFVTNSKSTMRRKGGEGVKLGSKSTHEHFLPLHGGRHLCGCVPHPLDVEGHGVEREAGWSTTRGSGQEVRQNRKRK